MKLHRRKVSLLTSPPCSSLFKYSHKFLPVILMLLFLCSCGLTQTRPKLEMGLAQAAFLAARETQAYEYTPNLYRQAEVFYLRAKSAYKRKYFNKAKQYAIISRKYAEKAEYNTKRKIILQGE